MAAALSSHRSTELSGLLRSENQRFKSNTTASLQSQRSLKNTQLNPVLNNISLQNQFNHFDENQAGEGLKFNSNVVFLRSEWGRGFGAAGLRFLAGRIFLLCQTCKVLKQVPEQVGTKNRHRKRLSKRRIASSITIPCRWVLYLLYYIVW